MRVEAALYDFYQGVFNTLMFKNRAIALAFAKV